MSSLGLLVLNLFWFAIETALIVAIARGTRPAPAIALALFLSTLAFAVETGFAPFRFHAMRAASFAIFLHLPLVLLATSWLKRKHSKLALSSLLAAAGLAVVGVDAFLYEPHALVTSTCEVKLGTTLRVVVMSDFQATHIGDYERGVLSQMAALDPELVLLAGDYLQLEGTERAAAVRDFRQAWQAANIHPRLGVFAVRGDVEPDGWEHEIFSGLGVTTADATRTVQAGELSISLLSLNDSARTDLSLSRDAGRARVVLGHRPDFALGTGPAGLLVAGHTHGGQVQLPFWGPPIILSKVPRAWGAGGLHTVDAERSLLVTRGAGVEHADDAPPLRFNCRPEIVALNLRP